MIIIAKKKMKIKIMMKKKDENKEKLYSLTVEGKGLVEVLQKEGINYIKTKSNNIEEISKVLGIEATRSSIIYELNYTYGNHGLHIDIRHLGLVSDIMTFKGAVLGFQRYGMIKMKDSVFLQSIVLKEPKIFYLMQPLMEKLKIYWE